MSIKYFCDICGKEMPPSECGRVRLRFGRVAVEVIHRLGQTWNGGQVCWSCIRETVAKGETSTEEFKPS